MAAKSAKKIPGVYPYETAAGTRWYIKYDDSDGVARTQRGFTSPTAAGKARGVLVGQADAGELRVASRERFDTYFDSWLAGRRPFLEPGTWADYEVHGRKRLKPIFGEMALRKIQTADIREWLAEAAESGIYAPKTLNNALGVLVVCLNQAAGDRVLPHNPALGVQRLPSGHVEREYLRLHEINLYLECCDATYRPLAELLVSTGLRISEALGLRWDDIDFARQRITVYRSRKGTGVGSTKGDKFRGVDAGPDLLERLRNLRAVAGERVSARELADRPVFMTPVRAGRHQKGRWASSGEQVIDRNTVSRDWHKAALADAGLRDMPLHALRHSAAAAWLVTGQPLVYVQRQLGHGSVTTTEKFYGHLEETFLRDAVSKTEAARRHAHHASPSR